MNGPAFDVVVIGAGPAGQKAAIQSAKAGKRALVIERGPRVGGECVERGTIPSKTLREAAVYLSGLRTRTQGVLDGVVSPELKLEALMRRHKTVTEAHQEFIAHQLARNGVDVWYGHARFAAPHSIAVWNDKVGLRIAEAEHVIVASGSRPRVPENVPVDHRHVLDSDSVLDLQYLPHSLTVLGGGVIACEFASVFAALGVKVTLVDRADRPLGFLDPELTSVFLAEFERHGGRFIGGARFERVEITADGQVETVLPGGTSIRSERLLCALGRLARVDDLGLEAVGVALTPQGQVAVDAEFRTSVPHVFAVGDVIGPPSLAATAMEQGRRAARHALGLPTPPNESPTPVGIYTIPEIASVGLSEDAARERGREVVVGRADFREIARGHINGEARGILKLVCDAADGRVLGAQIVGEGATELVHVAQVAIVGGLTVDVFVENVFNFPTLAEAFRVAGLAIAGRREADTLKRAA